MKSKAKPQGHFLKQMARPQRPERAQPKFTWAQPVAPAPRTAPAHPQVRMNDFRPNEAPAASTLPRNSKGQPDIKRIRARVERVAKKGKS